MKDLKYYKLIHNNSTENEITAHCMDDFTIQQNALISGLPYYWFRCTYSKWKRNWCE